MLQKLGTLKFKFPLISFFTYLILISVILSACYVRFSHNMKETYKEHGEEILNLAAEEIVIDHIPDYLSGNYDQTEYNNSVKKLNLYPYYFDEVFYLYAYHLNDDGLTGTYLFDAQVNHDNASELGDLYEIEDDILAQINTHGAGEPLDAVTDNTQWGYLMTVSKPLLDSKGNFQGYLFVDFDLTKVRDENRAFIFRLFGIAFALMLAVFALGMQAVAVRITEPIEKIYLCLSKFRYATIKDRQDNLELIRGLNIHTNHEIQSLYEALLAGTESNLRYMTEFRNISEKLGAANEKAYTDVMTGVGNKASFENKAMELLGKIDHDEKPEVAVIMADINNLKYVNDTFGHKSGDEYIIGCCKILSDFCENSHVYRIGGDEFVIVLEGDDFTGRKLLIEMMRSHFIDTYTDEAKEPWQRYSVSLGMAEYQSSDIGFSDVMKRADDAMYKAKTQFKEKYGSYR